VPPHRIPGDPAAQVGMYRSLLAGRRMLVVLDNARGSERVRPLLPGAPGCLVLVTSRTPMPDLIAAEGAHPLAVDPLSAAEAHELLVRRLGTDRVAAEPDAVREIVAACAGLPRALATVAARAVIRPRSPLRDFAAEAAEAAEFEHARQRDHDLPAVRTDAAGRRRIDADDDRPGRRAARVSHVGEVPS
jgi:hypothetical protein